MTALTITLLVFLVVGALFVGGNLLAGRLIRPNRPSAAKGEIYECGESPVGTAWIQFDLRFYVVALLFVIFDVELAFFFPWAVVFGSANRLGDDTTPPAARVVVLQELTPGVVESQLPEPSAARAFARFAFVEMLAFFAVLLVGFAYLWSRGDLEWVRSLQAPAVQSSPTGPPRSGEI